ncbi:MAG TPA: CerR family C-terminal domain-containing protein [Acidobacteriaceae bacterium]|nr:CerR family C-terminal domain-containing protein [Acidobacteriaceae bacterium]
MVMLPPAKPRSARPRPRRPSISDPTRERLIDCAGPIFADRGFQATTIREISTVAGENVAAIHYHFGDKLGLYSEVVLRSTRAAQVDAIRSALAQQAPPDQILRAVIRARLQSLNRRDLPDWHFRILLHEFASPTPALGQVVEHVGRPIFLRVLDLIGGMLGLPPTDERTRLCAISVMGQIIAYVFATPLLAGVWPELKMTPEQVERIATHIGDFSLAYIQTFRAQHQALEPQPVSPAARNGLRQFEKKSTSTASLRTTP